MSRTIRIKEKRNTCPAQSPKKKEKKEKELTLCVITRPRLAKGWLKVNRVAISLMVVYQHTVWPPISLLTHYVATVSSCLYSFFSGERWPHNVWKSNRRPGVPWVPLLFFLFPMAWPTQRVHFVCLRQARPGKSKRKEELKERDVVSRKAPEAIRRIELRSPSRLPPISFLRNFYQTGPKIISY